VKEDPPNLFATLGFGSDVNLSGPEEKAAERLAKDGGVDSSAEPPVAAGETG
jgi:hypothetical protein